LYFNRLGFYKKQGTNFPDEPKFLSWMTDWICMSSVGRTTATTQSRRLFASPAASIKLEKLRFARKLNHFALKAKIDWAASKAAWIELGKMKRAERGVT
jgi:hypothetical protein